MLDQTPSFASVACRLGEPQLERALEELADNVRNEISNANLVPLRSDVRDDLNQLKADAERLRSASSTCPSPACLNRLVLDNRSTT